MEGSCSTGQSPQWAVVLVEEEEDSPVCVTCTVNNLCCNLHKSQCREDCNRLMTITALFWVTTRVVIIDYRRFGTSYRTTRNNPEERLFSPTSRREA
jgi:hypothetical protein